MLARWPDLVDAHWRSAKITLRAALAALASFRAGAGLRPDADRLAAGPLSRADQERLGRSWRVCTRPSRPRPRWADSSSSPGWSAGTLVFGDWRNPYLPIVILLVVRAGGAGRVRRSGQADDRGRGMSARTKLLAQTLIAAVAAVLVYRVHARMSRADWSWSCRFAARTVSLGWLFIPLATLVIVGSSNAVNLADGLDGLAGGCLVCATGAMALVVYASGHAEWAGYLNIPHIAGAGEMAIVAAAHDRRLAGFLVVQLPSGLGLHGRHRLAAAWADCWDCWP